MSGLGDRFNQFIGKTRFLACRIFVHLGGEEIAPLLGVLNQAARDAVAAEGDINALGEGLVNLCQSLLEYSSFWRSAANEGDVFWEEGEAGDYVTELFTDSAGRYLSSAEFGSAVSQESLTLPATRNLVVMITVACEGEVPDLETDLADLYALEAGLKALINLQYQGTFRAIQVHYSPAQFGDELTDEQVLLNFPELIPL
jgi:Protein of unknown function (DUF1517)